MATLLALLDKSVSDTTFAELDSIPDEHTVLVDRASRHTAIAHREATSPTPGGAHFAEGDFPRVDRHRCMGATFEIRP
jgi:hypothetical protein